MSVYTCTLTLYVTVEINDESVIERVTGSDGDEWRSQYYDLRDAEDVIEHLVGNAVRNGVEDVRRLDGWADVDRSDAVTFQVDDSDYAVERVSS